MRGIQYTISRLRQVALENGEKSFFTGLPCRFGHIAKRSVENGSCYACMAEAAKRWRAKRRGNKPYKKFPWTEVELIAIDGLKYKRKHYVLKPELSRRSANAIYEKRRRLRNSG